MPIIQATYVYCLVAGERRPALRRPRTGLPGAGPVRLLALDVPRRRHPEPSTRLHRWLVVADVPLAQYGEAEINQRLNDLDWVSRAAVAHERVVESFRSSDALLPMKLFTIFSSDDRAAADLLVRRREVDRILRRVMNHDEWGVRIVLDRAAVRDAALRRPKTSGTAYLTQKKAARNRTAELVARSRDVTSQVFDTLAARSTAARRRAAADLPAAGATLLLDGAFLVARSAAARFRAAAGREARALAKDGYELTLTGPWPAYSFMQE